jgi:hypothetical protein
MPFHFHHRINQLRRRNLFNAVQRFRITQYAFFARGEKLVAFSPKSVGGKNKKKTLVVSIPAFLTNGREAVFHLDSSFYTHFSLGNISQRLKGKARFSWHIACSSERSEMKITLSPPENKREMRG